MADDRAALQQPKEEAGAPETQQAGVGQAPGPAVQDTVEFDRRGKPLPARQRVGGIITPQ